MKHLVQTILKNKHKTVPVLSFPSTQLLGITVRELISSADRQAQGMKAIVDRCPVGASLNMMDLSVEAEAFGASVRVADDEVPTVDAGVLKDISEAESLAVPPIGAGRTGIYIEGVKKAKEQIADVPVFCGVIGPYSLAGRLFDMTELMMACFDSPEKVHVLLQKVTDFLIAYIRAFKQAGADGVVVAEPAAGLLSPELAKEFSSDYMRRIVAAVNAEDFVICYHNCGNAVVEMAEDLANIGADMYHFGNAITLADLLPKMPADRVVMGNVNPLLFRNGTPEEVENATRAVYEACNSYPNFMLSSGCDIPAAASWDCLDAYFTTVTKLYE